MPYDADNQKWLRNGEKKRKPVWVLDRKYWELPTSRFNELVKMFLHRFGQVYILQPYHEREVCSPSCMNANALALVRTTAWEMTAVGLKYRKHVSFDLELRNSAAVYSLKSPIR